MHSSIAFDRKRAGGFTLVEIMIVICIMALLAEIAVPGFIQARQRSRAQACVGDLTRIDNAKSEYAMQAGLITGSACTMTNLVPTYIVRAPSGPVPGAYTPNIIGNYPTFTIQGGAAYTAPQIQASCAPGVSGCPF